MEILKRAFLKPWRQTVLEKSIVHTVVHALRSNTMLGGFEFMADARDKRAAEIQDSIRQILLLDWSPIGAGVPSDEYDAYIAPVYRILVSTRSEQELCEFLFRTARDTIGVAGDTVEHFELGRPVARKLLELDVRL
jgi:hypothetical protein